MLHARNTLYSPQSYDHSIISLSFLSFLFSILSSVKGSDQIWLAHWYLSIVWKMLGTQETFQEYHYKHN